MAQFKIRYSTLYEKWQVLRKTVVGWVCLEEFREKEDALVCAERLAKRKSKRA